MTVVLPATQSCKPFPNGMTPVEHQKTLFDVSHNTSARPRSTARSAARRHPSPIALEIDPAERTCVEFFAGIGLARLGLEQAGWRVLFANDIDAAKKAMYEAHFGPAPHYFVGDVHALAISPELVPDARLAHASFPCTDLSLAGARRGIHAGESSAFWGFHAWLEAKGDRRPPLVLLENVTGFLSSHGGEDFLAALGAMNALGYGVDPIFVDAAHFVPQSRPRLFIVCKRDAPRDGDLAPDALDPTPLRPSKLLDAIRATPEIDWSIADLPELPPYGQTTLASILDDPPEDSPEWWSGERAEYLLNQMSDRHRAAADAMIAGPKWSCGAVFRRVRKGRSMAELRTDGLAGCLRTPKGGSGRQILFQGGGGAYRVRLINPAECARLMGADGFRVEASLNRALFGFGDGVCVDAMRWIAENYLNRLTFACESPSGCESLARTVQ